MVKISATGEWFLENRSLSLLCVLHTLKINEKIGPFLAEVLDKEAPSLGPLRDNSDQYCVRKAHGHNHKQLSKKSEAHFSNPGSQFWKETDMLMSTRR